MERKLTWIMLILFLLIPMAMGTVPGTFFWRPRLGIDLNLATTEDRSKRVHLPTKDNIQEGKVVLIDGYQVGMTVIAFAAGISSAEPYVHLNPMSAYYYTNIYRWALRYFSLIPFWMSGHGGNYVDSHKVWHRRFYYMDQFVPHWLRGALPYVNKKEWNKEELEFKRFRKYAEPAFGKHYRYPTKRFNDFKSEQTHETVENLDASSNSLS